MIQFSASTLAAWAVFLLIQNASFTFVSRARNSGSYSLHAIAAVCSNGIWMAAQFVSLGLIIDTIKTGVWQDKLSTFQFPPSMKGFNGYCYHCKTDTHIKSGGCWTTKYARRHGVPGETIVVRNS